MDEYKILLLLNSFDCMRVTHDVGVMSHLYLSVTNHDFLFLDFEVELTKTPFGKKIEEISGHFLRFVALVGFNVVFNGVSTNRLSVVVR